jgi:phospholipid/cholesterol/gamma-HCH transport system substrate-binding protein
MTVTPARLLTFLLGVAAVTALVVALLSGGDSGYVVKAEFSNARGLVKGNDVRVNGAPAGTVKEIELTDRGTALVTLELHDGLPQVRSDASASIRPVDLLGDVYLSLSLGEAGEPLAGDIPAARTTNAPRLDQLLNTFQPSQRLGLRALLVETGVALDARGVDLNRAFAELRPALSATDDVMRELGSQNAALKSLVTDAQRVTGQAAPRSRDLGRLVSSLSSLVKATDARRPALDRGVAQLPATLSRVRSTADELAKTARAARPLAASLRDSAPALTTAAQRLTPFLGQAKTVARQATPTLGRVSSFLQAGGPTFTALNTGLTRLGAAAPNLNRLMDAVVPAAPAISEGFFVNFPDQAAEPGNQPFDPFADPRRHYWRGAAVVGCETFGVKVEPNCMANVLATLKRGGGGSRSSSKTRPAADSPASSIAPLTRRLERQLGVPLSRVVPRAPDLGRLAKPVLDYLLGP